MKQASWLSFGFKVCIYYKLRKYIHILVQEEICFILQWSVHTHETSQRQSWFLCSNWVNPPFHPLLLLFFYTTALDLTQCVHRIESHHLGQKQSMPWHCLLPFPSLSVGGKSDIRVLCISIKMQCFLTYATKLIKELQISNTFL